MDINSKTPLTHMCPLLNWNEENIFIFEEALQDLLKICSVYSDIEENA